MSHDMLLEKLDRNGIRDISNDWFRFYLSDRFQFVSINDFTSDYKTIKQGVPQGPILGKPLAYLNFQNVLNIRTKHPETLQVIHVF